MSSDIRVIISSDMMWRPASMKPLPCTSSLGKGRYHLADFHAPVPR
jgi:hypothetical protein